MITNSIDYALMTEKSSVTNKNAKESNPWTNTDDNGIKTHIYWPCKASLLQASIGDVLFSLINTAVQQTWENEYRRPGQPYLEPRFYLDNDNPCFEFIPNSSRFIDPYDLNKGSFLKNRPALFHPWIFFKLSILLH